MRYVVTISALALATVLSACGGGAKQEEFTRADADLIRQAANDFTAAFNAKDVDKILGLYAENSVFMPPNAPLLRGREPLRGFYGDLFAKGATNLQMDPDEVGGFGPIAYEWGTYSVSYSGPDDRGRGKYLRVLRNTGGTWRIEKMMWSSDLPPAPPKTN